jgi:uncharacterized membrane protein
MNNCHPPFVGALFQMCFSDAVVSCVSLFTVLVSLHWIVQDYGTSFTKYLMYVSFPVVVFVPVKLIGGAFVTTHYSAGTMQLFKAKLSHTGPVRDCV